MDVITFQMGPGGIVDPQWQGVRAAYEHSLWAEGIGAGVRVGVRASLDAEAISALFAIVRRGACAVLLNPRDPEARRTAVCAQAGAVSLPAPSTPAGLLSALPAAAAHWLVRSSIRPVLML
jgi:acyl-CoA synthetase (AMP-forming)/AMP-acid ligase II